MSNHTLSETKDFLWQLLEANGWDTRSVFEDETDRSFILHSTFPEDGVELTLQLVELSRTKTVVTNFDVSPINPIGVWQFGAVYPERVLELMGKSIDYKNDPSRCFIIEHPVDALSLIESHDRIARAFHFKTIIKEIDNI